MAISNFTGAALEQQSAILDARAAQSTMLSSDLLGKRLPVGLAPAEAVFGAGGFSPETAALLAPSDGALLGPDLGLGAPTPLPNLGALQQNFLLP